MTREEQIKSFQDIISQWNSIIVDKGLIKDIATSIVDSIKIDKEELKRVMFNIEFCDSDLIECSQKELDLAPRVIKKKSEVISKHKEIIKISS